MLLSRPVTRFAAEGVLSVALVAWSAGVGGAGPVALWGPLPPGSYAPGFRILNARDPSRGFPGTGAGRPIQIALWYPARGATGAAMTYGDYVRLAASERTLTPPSPAESDEALVAYRRFLEGAGAPAPAVDDLLAGRMAALRDADPVSGRFSVVVIAQGNGGAAPDQALLAEYLATYGYVVATSPSPARLGHSLRSDADILPCAAAQASDLAFVVRQLRSFPTADPGPLGLVGYSFGGRSALLLAAAEPRVRALVSLDSGIAVKTGRGWLPPGRIDLGAVRARILHVFEDTEDFMVPDLGLLARLRRSDRRLVRVSGLGHLDFITYGMARALVPNLGGGTTSALADKVGAVFDIARRFLDEGLRAGPEAAAGVDQGAVAHRLPPQTLTAFRMKPAP